MLALAAAVGSVIGPAQGGTVLFTFVVNGRTYGAYATINNSGVAALTIALPPGVAAGTKLTIRLTYSGSAAFAASSGGGTATAVGGALTSTSAGGWCRSTPRPRPSRRNRTETEAAPLPKAHAAGLTPPPAT